MTKKLAIIYHSLAALLDAGLPILKALESVREGTEGPLRRIFSGISESISQGNSFADSMAKYPKVFGGLDVMMVRTAEISGELPNCFKLLSNWYEFSNRVKRILLSGLLLPFLIFHIMVLIVPLPSMALGNSSIAEYIVKVATGLGVLYLLIGIPLVIYYLTPNTGLLRRFFDALILRIPLMGQAVRQLSISRYSMGFNMLYKAGVPIKECTTRASEVTGNQIIADMFKGGAASVSAGDMAYKGFSRRLPTEYLDLWQVGEQAGELDKIVDKIAEISGDRAEHLFMEFARWFPRLVYALVSILIIYQILMLASMVLAI